MEEVDMNAESFAEHFANILLFPQKEANRAEIIYVKASNTISIIRKWERLLQDFGFCKYPDEMTVDYNCRGMIILWDSFTNNVTSKQIIEELAFANPQLSLIVILFNRFKGESQGAILITQPVYEPDQFGLDDSFSIGYDELPKLAGFEDDLFKTMIYLNDANRPLFICNPPVCNYAFFKIYQRVEAGTDHYFSPFDRLGIDGRSIKWNVLVSKACLDLISKISLQIDSEKSFSFFLLGAPGSGKSFVMYMIGLYFRSQTEKNVRIVYLPDCFLWIKSKCPMKFFLDELIYSLSRDDFGTYLLDIVNDIANFTSFNFLFKELSSWAKQRNIFVLFLFDQINKLDCLIDTFPFCIGRDLGAYSNFAVICSSSNHSLKFEIFFSEYEKISYLKWLLPAELEFIAKKNSNLANLPVIFKASIQTGLDCKVFCESKITDPLERVKTAKNFALVMMREDHRRYMESLPSNSMSFVRLLQKMLSFKVFADIEIPKTYDHKAVQPVKCPSFSILKPKFIAALLKMDAYEARLTLQSHSGPFVGFIFFPVRLEYLDILIEFHQLSICIEKFFKYCRFAIQNCRFNSSIKGSFYEQYIINSIVIREHFALHLCTADINDKNLYYLDFPLIICNFREDLPPPAGQFEDAFHGVFFRPLDFNHEGFDFYVFDAKRKHFFCVQTSVKHLLKSMQSLTDHKKMLWIDVLTSFERPYRIGASFCAKIVIFVAVAAIGGRVLALSMNRSKA